MKKIVNLLLATVLLFSVASVPVYALSDANDMQAKLTASYNGAFTLTGEGAIFQFGDFMPGDVIYDEIILQNDASYSVDIALTSIDDYSSATYEKFLEALPVTISNGGETLYAGYLLDATTSTITLNPNSTTTLDIALYIPSDFGNSAQGMTVLTEWWFQAAMDDIIVNQGIQSGVSDIYHANWLFPLTCVSGGVLILLLLSGKKKKAPSND